MPLSELWLRLASHAFPLFHPPPVGCPRGGPHYSQALLQWDPCSGSAVAQERPQGILWSLEEVSSYQRCACFSKPGEISPSNPCPDSPKSPLFCHFLFLISPCTLLPSRGRWQWEVPKQIGAPPSLSDWEVRVEVEAVPESSGKEDLPLGPQTGPQQLAPASEWPCPAARPQIWAPSHIYSASLLCFLVKESAANIIFIITLSHNLPFK